MNLWDFESSQSELYSSSYSNSKFGIVCIIQINRKIDLDDVAKCGPVWLTGYRSTPDDLDRSDQIRGPRELSSPTTIKRRG